MELVFVSIPQISPLLNPIRRRMVQLQLRGGENSMHVKDFSGFSSNLSLKSPNWYCRVTFEFSLQNVYKFGDNVENSRFFRNLFHFKENILIVITVVTRTSLLWKSSIDTNDSLSLFEPYYFMVIYLILHKNCSALRFPSLEFPCV